MEVERKEECLETEMMIKIFFKFVNLYNGKTFFTYFLVYSQPRVVVYISSNCCVL